MAFGIFGRPRQGGSQNEAAVNVENQLAVRAITEPDIEFVNDAFGMAFTWTSTDAAANGEESIYVENGDNLRELHISHVYCSGDTASIYSLIGVTSGTAAGTTITAKTMNRQETGITPEGTFFGNAAVTGSVDGDVLMIKEVGASITIDLVPEGGIILGKGNAIAVRQTATNALNITIVGFYEAKVV